MKSISNLKNQRFSRFSLVLALLFVALTIYFLFQPALYSPDSYGYLRGDFKRFPGYVIFTRMYTLVLGGYFDIGVIFTQLVLGFLGVFVFLKKVSNLLQLELWAKILLLGILVFPFFPPLWVANNITSEGLAYPFYLFSIAYALEFLFKNENKKILHFSIFFILLTLTRGQFIVVPVIVSFIYFLKNRKEIFRRKNIVYVFILIVLPIFGQLLNRSYNKVIYGHFVTTPFNYVNAVTLPLFVSHKEDAAYIENEADKTIFLKSYQQIDSLGLLGSDIEGSVNDKYMVFHNHFPQICNQNIFEHGKDYYRAKDGIKDENSIKIEQSCKRLFPLLISRNFNDYIRIYFEGVFHGFKSIFIAIFILLLSIYSFVVCLKKVSLYNGLLLFSTLLIISNALIVAIACHSIIRYLFYNYALGFLIIWVLFKKIKAHT